METQRLTVRVAGKNYKLSFSDEPEHIKRLVSFTNRRIAEAGASSLNMDRETAAVAAALSLADDLMKAQDDNARLRRAIDAKLAKVSDG